MSDGERGREIGVRGEGCVERKQHWHAPEPGSLQGSIFTMSVALEVIISVNKRTWPASQPLPLLRSIQSKTPSSGSLRVLSTFENNSRKKS